MNSVSNQPSRILENTFAKVDVDKSKGLDRSEFQSFYEVLKAGIAKDEDGNYGISEDEYFKRMDHNKDGVVAEQEMLTTGVLMPASLCDDSLVAMIEYLKTQATDKALLAADLLSREDEEPVKDEATTKPPVV